MSILNQYSSEKIYRLGQMFHALKILWDSANKTRDKSLALESQTSIHKLEAPSANQPSSKCIKLSKKKINFIKTVFVSISINRDMVLKWKLGQLVWTDHLPLKRISFSSTHCRSIVCSDCSIYGYSPQV